MKKIGFAPKERKFSMNDKILHLLPAAALSYLSVFLNSV